MSRRKGRSNKPKKQARNTPAPPPEAAEAPAPSPPPETRHRTHDAPTVEKDLPRCINPGCESTEFEFMRKIGELDFHGHRESDGRPYTSITRRRVRCRGCGQVQVHKSYRFDPTLWRGD